MSSLSELLRGSRLSQVPLRKKVPLVNPPKKFYPQHQIIATKPNTMKEFKEWGLKAAIPSVKSKTKYIVVNELDNKYRMTEFEPISGGFNWNRLRLQELNIAPQNIHKKNPLFFENESKAPSLKALLDSKAKREYLKSDKFRSEFKTWLLEKYPNSLYQRGFHFKNLEKETLEFLQDRFGSHKHSMSNNIVGCGGLSYNLKGRVANTPNGFVLNPIVAGRILNGPSSSERIVSVAGFAGVGRNNEKLDKKDKDFGRAAFRQNKVPIQIKNYKVINDGSRLNSELRVNILDDVNLNAGSAGVNNRKKFFNLGAQRSKPSSTSVNDSAQSKLQIMEFLSGMMKKD